MHTQMIRDMNQQLEYLQNRLRRVSKDRERNIRPLSEENFLQSEIKRVQDTLHTLAQGYNPKQTTKR